MEGVGNETHILRMTRRHRDFPMSGKGLSLGQTPAGWQSEGHLLGTLPPSSLPPSQRTPDQWLRTTECIPSYFRKLEVHSQHIRRAMLPVHPLRGAPLAFAWLLTVAGNPASLGLHCSAPASALAVTWLSPCPCLHMAVSL